MNRPLDITLTVLCVLALGTSVCGGCYRGARAARTAPPGPALVELMSARAVRVDFVCLRDGLSELGPMTSTGSGVVVDESRVMTAAHVAHCPDGQGRAIVTTADERYVYTKLIHAAPVVDLAMLESLDAGAFAGLAPPVPVAGGALAEDDVVCMAAAVPERVVNCGLVDRAGDFPPKNIHYTAHSTYGNSGGGVYDKRGNLVGINTHCDLMPGDGGKPDHLKRCDPAGGGSGTALDGLERLVRP